MVPCQTLQLLYFTFYRSFSSQSVELMMEKQKKLIQRHVIVASKIKSETLTKHIWKEKDGILDFKSTKEEFNTAIKTKLLEDLPVEDECIKLGLSDVYDISCISVGPDKILVEYITEIKTKSCKCGTTNIPLYRLQKKKKKEVTNKKEEEKIVNKKPREHPHLIKYSREGKTDEELVEYDKLLLEEYVDSIWHKYDRYARQT